MLKLHSVNVMIEWLIDTKTNQRHLAMAEKKEYHMPGEHIHKGKRYPRIFTPSCMDKVEATTFDDSDIIVSTYPKSGTTWMKNISWMVLHGNLQSVVSLPWGRESFIARGFLEMEHPEYGELIDYLHDQRPPRLMYTHLSEDFFPTTLATKKTKFIIVMRNVKDTLQSLYNFYTTNKQLGPFTVTWSEFLEMFYAKKLMYGDYFEWNLGWWKHRNNPNVLIMKYEDMLEDPEKAVAKVATLMGKNISQDMIKKIADVNSFANMKKNVEEATKDEKERPIKAEDFFRKGKVGSWKEYFSEEESKAVDKLIHENLNGSGLDFIYE